jgi:hypothetical protein
VNSLARLQRSLAPELVEALLALVDERVDERILARERDREQWIPVSLAAEISGLSAPAIRERIRRGLPARKNGGRLLVCLSDAQELRPSRRYNHASRAPTTGVESGDASFHRPSP